MVVVCHRGRVGNADVGGGSQRQLFRGKAIANRGRGELSKSIPRDCDVV